jgi:asparagine synthase (glutamine-hydrolysing)
VCGIAGIVSQTRRGAITALTRALAHRGPDDEGFYEDEHIALGQRRLSIIDLAGGKQPIGSANGRLQLLCNGEIYNSVELRKQLIARGHRFKTATDVEVILHLYEEHGESCVDHLRGMFAFALWDQDKRKLLLARDHLGQKPLFFHHDGNELYFASEVKALLDAGLVRPAVDLDALWHYVSLRFIPDRYSLFKGIQKLPAAHMLVFQDGKVSLRRYWQPHYTEKRRGSEAELEEELDALLRDTVALHLLSDVPVGAFLSGGIDSSTIAALMAQQSPGPVPSFSIGVKEQGFNELPYARMVSSRYGMDAHEEVVSADLARLIPRMVHHLDEPSDPFAAGVYLVSRLASKHVKVVLSGDGGDENFAGYDRFAGQQLAELYAFIPQVLRRTVMRSLIKRIPQSFGYKSLAQKAQWLNEMSFYTAGHRYAESMSFLRFSDEAKQKLFTASARDAIEDRDSLEKILRHFDLGNATELVDRMLYTDLMTRMPDHLLPIVDRMSMAHSLETRAPLVDYKVVEFAASLPGHMKLKGRKLKYLLKKVAARHLPRELIYREKQGFGFPLALWMRNELSTFVRSVVRESRLVQAGMFDPGYMSQLTEEHINGQADHNFRLWILINLEFWYRLYVEGESVENLEEDVGRLVRGGAAPARQLRAVPA